MPPAGERASRLYRVLPFYIACFLVNLPVEAVPQIAQNIVVYYMCPPGCAAVR